MRFDPNKFRHSCHPIESFEKPDDGFVFLKKIRGWRFYVYRWHDKNEKSFPFYAVRGDEVKHISHLWSMLEVFLLLQEWEEAEDDSRKDASSSV